MINDYKRRIRQLRYLSIKIFLCTSYALFMIGWSVGMYGKELFISSIKLERVGIKSRSNTF